MSLYLQIVINLTLCTGLILFIIAGIKIRLAVMLFFSGELALELTDLVGRLMKLNTLNTYNYALSQFLSLIMLTEIYRKYCIRIPDVARGMIYLYAGALLMGNMIYMQSNTSVTFYSNIISSIIICSFAAAYFMKIIRRGRAEKSLFVINILVFLFFSVECLISTTFSFLISNHLDWVAPVWLFRGVLLLSFYIAFINLGWCVGKIRVR
ncbi:MAG: hypothetical protein MUW56_03325 [Chryseobacterium sp.]|uniref:hypothetical protein n=1 Tax=Chryseobacterium sp. TaxID=1871047 RepID=UPI0025C722CA|nr:hypothetical protein [Chryseobacterium sp.]MCJ7932679.1 hypothetical protein [Chryseobacterium sp.]